ncbi:MULTISPECIES: cysteine ABC transporter substrate-binding protein [Helicobacter]|uniref:Lysine-arginine-ornithine-binding periplasmic protein (TC 3.A.1.3.1) n=1 Tax=Helicobacter typhlonius TaxID=76936 RepID=A0A099UF56_9HELI|nr:MULTISPECIES: cysteine ABC transporter substrate-binding protein [Helicobacter]TLD79538.1 transporter substrate-binding domain-containing protein [Helicobacter typhlonius]TLD88353.1 transporter substrate-binding domain-containing protein [Helicobacter sp. MIT 03-1616]CUU39341.1 Lysine-arginine-ornithine-binding periplasmic protein precursor (TC 3.A.1.3.1) [Helicobacter typhlonius]HCD72764.1 ABC transporter substrate-binding protein [Helicobacter sp.]
MKKWLLTFVGLAFIVFFSACSNNGTESNTQDILEQIKQKGIVRIGVFSDKPPFGFVNENGKNDGFDVFISKRIAQDLLGDENKIEFVFTEAASRVEFLRSNKVDIIMANFTQTPEREAVVDFAKPYMKVALGVVSPNGNITNVDELKGKKLIVNKGTTADTFFSKNYPEIELLKYEQNTEAFLALKDGRGDALAHDNTLVLAWAMENDGFAVGIATLGDEDVIAPAVKKGNEALKTWLDNEIDTLTKNGFMKEAYMATLAPIFGEEKMDSVILSYE